MKRFLVVLWIVCLVGVAAPTAAPSAPAQQDGEPKVTSIPEEVIKKFKLETTFYKKHLDYKGFSILSSAKVSDAALYEARFLIDKLLGEREDILKAMIQQGCRFMVMAPTEMTTDVPEQRHLKNDPKTNWDQRARGLGGKLSSCGEENLLNLKGDRYNKENILIHEFNHAIHQQGLRVVDPTFDTRLREAFKKAMDKGLWKGTYLTTNHSEYWAEGTQAYFDCMRPQYGANTREKLEKYDPDLFKLVDEVYKQSKFRYVRYDQRNPPAAKKDQAAQAQQPLVVDIWPGKPPGDVGIPGEEKFIEIKQAPDIKWITNVSKPTLTLYRPARDKDTGTAVLIAPGGGYHNLAWDREGTEVAEWLNSIGVTGIVLKYRCPRRPGDVKGEPPAGPLKDAQRAISLVRSNAKEWGIDPKRIGMIGFSAGGHLVGSTCTNFDQRSYEPIDAIDQISCRPDFGIMAYSGYFKRKDKDEIAPTVRTPAGTPPLFFVHASDDPVSEVEHSVIFYLALKRAKIDAALHVYASGGHGFGVRQDGPCGGWTRVCTEWMRQRGFLPGKALP
jgi:acetyl esterase/lipase